MEEKGKLVEILTITKYKSEKDYKKKKVYDVIVEKCENGKCLLNAGITKIWNLIIGGDEAEYDNATSEIGIGDSNTAADPTQTDLQAVTNKTWKAMAATYPQVSNQKVTFQAEFGSTDANYAWEECGVRQTEANVLMNRIVATKDTKTEGEVWTAKLEITLS
ncbi:hypothetical protein ES707_14572 [subsurface metagenome]